MEISKLLEIFEEGKSPRDLGQSFRSDLIRPGLERFYSILKSGIGDLGDGRRGFEIWTRPQIEAVVSVAKLIISATISGSVEHVDSLVLLIVESSLEFCICYLEKSLEDCVDLSSQNGLVLLMEIALTDEIGKELNVTHHESSSTYLVPLTVIPVDLCSMDLSHTTICNPQGNNCLKKTNSVDMLVKALASEVTQPENLVKRFTGSLPLYSSYSMVSLAQHWTVVHLKFFPRLLLLCCKLLHRPVLFEEHTEADSNYSLRLSLSLRVLKLLGNLARGIPHDSPDTELLCALASCAETFPTCFKLKMDSANSDWMATGSNTASLLLIVMEEFLQFVQIVSLDCSFLQNIQTCLVAAMLGILDSKEWRYDTSNSSPRPPLIYYPQVVLYLLKLLKDSNIWKDIKDDPSYYCCESEAGVSCCIRSEKFFFLKKYTCEQKLRIIFPASEQWLDNLTHLAFFLYFEGLKSRPKVETLVSTCTKPAVVPELESAVSHEEDALFGNLFSEAGRSVGSTDGLDQPISAVTVISSSHHFQAVIELLSFLKAYVFSYELNSPILLDAFGKIDKNLIDYLLSILISQVCLTDERNLGSSAALPLQKTLMHVNENCFGLLHNLITQQAFPISLIEHLIDQVLKVENGVYIYNNYSLALLAHVLISRPCVDGARVRRKICNKFSDFMLEKAKNLLLKCPEPSNFFRALPSSFHLEILLLAFHLSDQPEKMALANSMFFSLRKIDAPPDGSSGRQHFYWGLIVSRLVLILRHMVLYPSSCPSWLLSHLRSRLREISSSGCFPQALSERLPSCASTVVETILGDYIKEVSLAGELLPQLIDVTPLPSAFCRKDHSFQHLGLNLDDLFASLSWILDTWRGKMANAVEHLVLERYIFLLCWDTLSSINSCLSRSLLMDCNWLNIDLLNVESFFRFGLIVTSGSSDILKDIDLSEIIFNLLQQLHCDLVPDKIVVQGWDFFKRGSWLTLVLSVLRVGIWRYSARHAVPGIESYWVEHPKGCDFFDIAEKIILDLFQGNKSGWLLNVLSSILSTYLEVFQRAFLSVLDCKNFYEDEFSPLLLLKHTRVDKTNQDILLERSGCKFTQLESVYGLMSKLDEVSTKAEAENKGVLNCLLQGFPSLWDPSSAALLSSVLTIREIMCTLDGYLKIKDAAGVHVEIKIVSQLLSKVMAIKSDRGLQGVHEKCETIYSSSIDQEKISGYYDLFSLKQIEGFLANINSREVIDTETHEMLITSVVDSIQALRKDNSKVEIFKFYMGIEEDVSEEVKDLFSEHRGDLLVLFDALVKCHSETVNLKILYLFTDLLDSGLCPGLKEKIQKKFLDMELLCISKFLEKRLLGSTNESPGGNISAKGSSTSLRESTMEFMMRIVIESNESLAEELHHRLIEAMLMSVDTAFLLYDVHTAKSYFSYLVRLLNGETSIRQLLEKTVMLIEKLAENDGLLEGLKFLLSFLGTALGDCGADRNTSEKHPSKGFSSDSFGSGSVISKTVESRKDSLNLVLLANQSGSASIERDATSADEDEDDGTSDGELGSIDKDEEEDSNSERALASKVCTFTSSGSNFMEQHWYFCYTCDLTVSKGCCSICAKVCHRGHRVVYSRSSRFFCDCGAGGVRGSSCQCLKPRKFSGSNNVPAQRSNNFQPFFSFPEDVDQAADSDSDLDYNVCMDIDNVKLSIPREVQDGLSALLGKLNMEDRVLEICSKLLHTVVSRKESNLSKDKKVILGNDKMLSYNVDILQLKKAFKSGSLDLKIKTDYPNSRELKSHLSSGSLNKSLLSVSVRGRLAGGEGDKVTIFDVGQLIGQPTVTPVTADKTNVKPLSRNIVRFEIVHLMFNPMVETYLAVAGYEECQVLTVNSRGEVTDRLSIELALQGSYIRRIEWIPGSQVQLMVVTNMFVKIYDLSQDNISPMHYFTLSNDLIIDATLVPASMGKLFLLVFSEDARLYRLEVSMEGDTGVQALTDIIQVQDKDVQPKGLSLSYSSTYRLVLLSYQDGTSLVGRLDSSATSLNEISTIYEDDQGGKDRPACLHHWKELLSGSGVFVCFSNLKSNAAIAVSMGPQELVAQNIRHGAGLALPVVGIAAYKPLSKDKMHCLVLHEDGSLQIYTHVPLGADTGVSLSADQTKKLGTSILQNKADADPNPEFPLDFFEKTMCITADIKLSSDAMKSIDSDGIKQKLASDDGFLESPSPVGFKVTVLNSNPDIVMVGFRIHVGNTSAVHIPSEIILFQRVIKLDEGMRSWYDVPLTIAESLLADEEFTICVGRTFDGSTMPRIDSLEVYGRAKDEFGWKEKMDAVLHMEAHTLCTNSSAAGAGKKYKTMQAALIEEQVLADALKLLSRVYSCCGPHFSTQIQDVKLELDRLKCKKFLETLFESDKEPLLHSAACHVLQAVFPKKEIYYHVKDTMCLLGVVKSIPMLVSRIGIGGAAATWVITEFTSQMQAASKIALNRRLNMVSFLEAHGSAVVDGLMQVLWGILDLERPGTQTINNIVIPSVELIYSYAECLALHGTETSGRSVASAISLIKKLLFAPYEAVQTSSSLAISSRLLQVPFPKQTMLSTDDAAENTVTTHVPSGNATAGNTQVMVEEDSSTSTVQYCCDGCSTVPILRRRWHCNVCPDFDLCEACYEVPDADRLPPPHSRDHPMSAIPIEIDPLGGDGSEIHFSMDELNDAGVIQVTADVSMQISPSSVHNLEAAETGDFPSSVDDQRIVSISASKRAVNSLLLRHLVEELKGWMETTSGVRAIPVMQLFYRLSSAVGGPFMDSSKPENLDLEKFVKWLLDEINLSKPFSAKSRTLFGEVAILVFMYFTLMLRNWHQPNSDSSQSKSGATPDSQDRGFVQIPSMAPASPSNDDHEQNEFASQLMRACSTLRQQSFLNYLMDILQQLVYIFKSSSVDVENGLSAAYGCGSLLTVRRELPAGNFSPFFTDSYAKAHRSDIFMDYHKLLLENTFRLVYSLVRPEKQEKSAEKSYKICAGLDLKLEGFQDVLCSYISNPHTTFVRRYARRLFLHLCGSKTHYYSVRDSCQLSTEVKRFYKIIDKSGGFQNPMPYERSVKLVKCLSAISEVAGARPKNWQKYCTKHLEILPFLMDGIFYFGEEPVLRTLKLLNLAFYTGKDMGHSSKKMEAGEVSNKGGQQYLDSKKKRKGEDGTEGGSEKSCVDMEQAIGIFGEKGGSILQRFINSFLLEWNSSSVRLEAKCVLYGIWHHGKQSFKEAMLTALLQKVKLLPMYGQNIVEYTELMTCLLSKGLDSSAKQYEIEVVDRCLKPDVISCIFETLHAQNELLANHPNSRMYNTLSSLVEFDGYYLESEPCVACSCPEVPYNKMKLESLKSETKFTDNRIIVKCTGSYTIQSVTMNVHDARKSKSVKILNLYYNNRPVADLSELKNNWSLWKRAKSCHLAFNQTELKVEFPIPITACNFMIELDSFYENLQASSLESLQCPRCSRSVTDKHGICGNCHENAYQCRQCRNINYENLDSFLCNECGYSKYGRFEFNFMAKPSFSFDNMENDDDMKKGLSAIESESENAHRRYQQLLGFKKPLLKLVSSIGEHEIDSQQKDTVQQMMASLPGPSCKINRKIALLGVLYGEKCKAAFDSVSKSVQTLQGLRRVLLTYLHQKNSVDGVASSKFTVPRSANNCYGCATTFVSKCMELLQVLSEHANCKKQLVAAGILSELFENNIHQGPKMARVQARTVLCAFSEGDASAVTELNTLIQNKVMYCLKHHRSIDIALAVREEMLLLSDTCSVVDEFWEARLRVAFQVLFASIKSGAKHPAISEHIILPCLRIISQACTPPKSDAVDKDQGVGKSASTPQSKNDGTLNPSVNLSTFPSGSKLSSEIPEKLWDGGRKGQDIPLMSYSEWERGASYLDFVRRQYKVSQVVKSSTQRARHDSQKHDYLAIKYALKWKRRACTRRTKSDFLSLTRGSWVSELILSACSQSIRSEVCILISVLCPPNSFRRFQLLNLLMSLLPETLSAGESAAEYFDLFFKMIDSEAALLFLTTRGCLTTLCRLVTKEVGNVESHERSLSIDISQGFILHKLIELLSKFLEVPNIRVRFMKDELLHKLLESLLVIRGLVVQKTKLINDCNKLLKDLLDSLLLESSENKRQFIRACISGLQNHGKERKGRTSLFILEELCNMICPSKPELVYLLILNKAHTQEEFIRGSMTKNPYSSAEIGPLMRDVKNKICHQLDLLGLLEDDYGMELLVGGNIISLDLSITQVYEQVWKKHQHHSQSQITLSTTGAPSSGGLTSSRDCPPMTVTYRLQGLDGEATEPMIKELEEEREESQDPEVEFAIAGAVRDFGGLEIILSMIKDLRDNELKSNQEELGSVLNLLMYCCKIRENRRALLRLGALGLLLETARRAFSVDAMEPAEGILSIVESLTVEANESDLGISQSVCTISNEDSGAGEQAKKMVLMFLERLCHPLGLKKSKQQRNNEMVARILPYLTYGEPAAMETLVQHFDPYLQAWDEFDRLQTRLCENPKDESLAQQAAKQRSSVENFVRVSESLKTSSSGERLKDIILEKGITDAAVRHLRECFAVAGQTGFRSTTEWASGLKLPSIPLILSMLRGLSKGHLATQRCIDEGGLLPMLHALEGVCGENDIGARAENLLDTLADKGSNGDDGFLEEKINKLRHATRNEMRRLALKKREELLQGLGMRQEFASDGGERIVVAQPVIEGLDDVEEEQDGLSCMVCREGYSLRPNDMLGVYTYSKRVNLGATASGGVRGDCVYTTVSHFNIIHFQCHQEAKRADAALKNPKKEWEGATLRNNETLCNCIFPLKGPSVPLTQYVRCVDQYWDNLNALGRADGSRLRLLTYDIVLMLARFATGASFSTDSKGGGRESNSRFLPFMLQMASHLLDQGSSSQQPRASVAKSVEAYLSSADPPSRPPPRSLSPARLPAVGSSDETVQFMMVNSLLSESYEDWTRHRPGFLQRGIHHAYMQHKHATTAVGSDEGSPSTDLDDSGKLFAIVHPMLVYVGLIEQLQRFFKLGKAEVTASDSGEGGRWEAVIKERLMNVKEMVGFSKEMLSWLEEMTSASDLMEAFDVMGALGDALCGGSSRCEDFVLAAIQAGKS